MADKKITQLPNLAGGQAPLDLLTAVDVSAAPAAQNVYSTLNDVFSELTKNISDQTLRFGVPGSAPAVSAAGKGALYFDGSAFKLSENGGAFAALAKTAAGATNQLAYFAAGGTTLSPLTLGTNLSITAGVLNAAGGGGGITSLNGLTVSAQGFARINDANVTLTINSSGTDHTFTLGWQGLLNRARQDSGTVYVDVANAWNAGITQGFQHASGAAGFRLVPANGDPATVINNGDLWYNSNLNKFRVRENGATKDLFPANSLTGSGTPNYLPYFSAANTLSQGFAFYDFTAGARYLVSEEGIYANKVIQSSDQIILNGDQSRALSAHQVTLRRLAGQTGDYLRAVDEGGGTALFRVTVNGDVRPRGVPYTWPGSNAVGQLTNDGNGNLTWTPGGGGGGAPGGATGQVQFNNAGAFGGIAGSSVSGANLTLGGVLTIATPAQGNLRLLDTTAANIGVWNILALDFFNQGGTGVHNHTFGINFNTDGAVTSLPRWAENWEPRFAGAAAPNGLFEKNWDFTSIDGTVSYRPFNFNVNLNTNDAEQFWRVWRYGIIHRNGSIGTHDALRVVATANGNDSVVSTSGRLFVGAVSETTAYRCTITGTPLSGGLLAIAPTSIAANDAAIVLNLPNATGLIYTEVVHGGATDRLLRQVRNQHTGGTQDFLWAGSNGDAWTRWLANQDWSAGVDRSDEGKWKLSNADSLGVNDRLSIAADGTAVFSNSVHVRSVPYVWPSANAGGVLTNDGSGVLSWAPSGGGTIGGSIAVNQIAVGSGANTISGSSNLTWSNGTLISSNTQNAVIGLLAQNTSSGTAAQVGYRAFADNVGANFYATSSGFTPSGLRKANQVYLQAETGAVELLFEVADATSRFVWGINGVERARLNSTGLGLGTNNPATKLEINNGTANTSGLRFTQLTNASPVGTETAYLAVDVNGNVVRAAAPSGGGTIGGSIAVNQIAVGSGANTISGSSNLVKTSSGGIQADTNTNGTTSFLLINSNAGTAAEAALAATANVAQLTLAATSSGYTTSGLTKPSQVRLASVGAAELLIHNTDASSRIVFGLNNVEMARWTSTGLGLGTTSPDTLLAVSANSVLDAAPSGALLHLVGANSTNARLVLDGYAANPVINIRRANGTAAAKSTLATDDGIFQLSGMGYDGSSFTSSGRVSIVAGAAQNWTPSAQGTYLSFFTTSLNSTLLTERLRITANGSLVAANVFSTYNGAMTAGLGLAPIYSLVNVTSATGTASGNLQVAGAIAPAGLYRVCCGINTRTLGSAGSVNIQINWHDGVTSRGKNAVLNFLLNTDGAADGIVALLKQGGGANIQWGVFVTGAAGAPTFDYHITLEQLA